MSDQVRVVEVIRGLGNGGTEQALIRRLHHQPPDVHTTVVSTAPELDAMLKEVPGVDVVMVDSPRTLLATLSRLNPNVVLTHMPRDSYRILRSKLPTRTPVIVVAHASVSTERALLQPLVTAVLRRVNRRAALHIAVSSSAARGRLCKGARAVVVQHLGGELDADAPLNDIWPAGTSFRLLTLSRITSLKNLPGLVHAVADEAAIMRSSKASLMIVGDGPESDEVQRAIDERGVQDIVGSHQAVHPAAGVLKSADVLMISSAEEGGPITVFEALLAGTRITSTPVGVAPDVLQDDPALILMHDASRESLRAGIRGTLDFEPMTEAERLTRAQASQQWEVSQTSRDFYAHLLSVVAKPSVR